GPDRWPEPSLERTAHSAGEWCFRDFLRGWNRAPISGRMLKGRHASHSRRQGYSWTPPILIDYTIFQLARLICSFVMLLIHVSPRNRGTTRTRQRKTCLALARSRETCPRFTVRASARGDNNRAAPPALSASNNYFRSRGGCLRFD